MQAQRIVTRIDSTGHITGLPLLPPGKSVEVIMLILDNQSQKKLRKAPASLIGKMREVGDIFSSAPAEDWTIA